MDREQLKNERSDVNTDSKLTDNYVSETSSWVL